MNINIIGAGKIGKALSFLFGPQQGALFDRNGLYTTPFQVNHNNNHSMHYPLIRNAHKNAVWIIATKAHQIIDTVNQYQSEFQIGCAIYLISNGYLGDVHRELRREFPSFNFLRGSCTVGSTQSTKTLNIHGDLSGVVLEPCTEIRKTPCQISTNIENSLAKKYFLNTVLNTLCAAYDFSHNGLVKIVPKTLARCISESYDLAQHLYGQSNLGTRQELRNLLDKTIEAVYANENSMRSDLRRGLQTESPYLAGMAFGYSGFQTLKTLDTVIVQPRYQQKKAREL